MAGRELLADPDRRPTAIMAQSDLLAAGVIRAAEDLGLRVPQDLSVVGFDGIALDRIVPHDLTTMVQPAAEQGRAAGRAVLDLVEGGADAVRENSAARSTAAPPPPHPASADRPFSGTVILADDSGEAAQGRSFRIGGVRRRTRLQQPRPRTHLDRDPRRLEGIDRRRSRCGDHPVRCGGHLRQTARSQRGVPRSGAGETPRRRRAGHQVRDGRCRRERTGFRRPRIAPVHQGRGRGIPCAG